MNTSEVLMILRKYRHDLMNDLQLVQGYASMGKHEISGDKLQALIQKLSSERSLQTLDAPEFVLWLTVLNLKKSHVNIEYECNVSTIESIKPHDEKMMQDGIHFFHQLEEFLEPSSMVTMKVIIQHNETYLVTYEVEASITDDENLIREIKKMTSVKNVDRSNQVYRFTFFYK